jgi:hypothetical protein
MAILDNMQRFFDFSMQKTIRQKPQTGGELKF